MRRLRCIVGTYERTLYGVDLILDDIANKEENHISICNEKNSECEKTESYESLEVGNQDKFKTRKESEGCNNNRLQVSNTVDGVEKNELSCIQNERLESDHKWKTIWNPVWLVAGHAGPIRAIAAGDRFMATGSSDEIIKLYDLKYRKDIGTLLIPASCESTCGIRDLAFLKRHLISAHESGELRLWSVRDWSLQASLRPSKQASKSETVKFSRPLIESLAVHHQSGAFAFTVGKGNILQLWNLIRGKVEKSQKLRGDGSALSIAFSKDGESFIVVFEKSITIFDKFCHDLLELKLTEINAKVATILETDRISTHGRTKIPHKNTFEKHITNIKTQSNSLKVASNISRLQSVAAVHGYFCIGTNNGMLILLDIQKRSIVSCTKAHNVRIKAIATLESYITSVASDGSISAVALDGDKLEIIGSHQISGGSERATCIALIDPGIEDLNEILRRRHVKNHLDIQCSAAQSGSDKEYNGSH